jgi:carbonic anhydrase
MIPAMEALERLRQGNARFVSGDRSSGSLRDRARQQELLEGQQPFAVVLGCSDSRVPVEIAFDQGLGDLFVIRVAGNVAAPSQIGSVEFAVGHLGTRLVVVLGHSRCGAVQATLDSLQQPPDQRSPNLDAIVRRVRPSVEDLLTTELRHDPEALSRSAIRANVRAAARNLRRGSDLIRRLAREGELLIVSAEYSLETGAVDFFDIPSGAAPGKR